VTIPRSPWRNHLQHQTFDNLQPTCSNKFHKWLHFINASYKNNKCNKLH